MHGRLILTAVQRRILQFFREHPHAVETEKGIATWVGVEANHVQEAIKVLVGLKWLLVHKTDAVTGYTLTSDKHFLSQMKESTGDPSP